MRSVGRGLYIVGDEDEGDPLSRHNSKCGTLFGVYPHITPGWMRTFMAGWAYSCDKARDELGYRPTPLGKALRMTYEWLKRIRGKE
ncbi:MAG: hypothetical protein R6U98_17515 [Pirellulaceae bacterium]